MECAFSYPVRTECGVFVMYCMQCSMSVSAVLCVLMVECMSVVVNVMLSLMSVMSPPPTLCNLSARTVVKLCTLGVFTLGVSLVS